MATYYVKPDGNDALDGLSELNAWATITHALTQMIANDELIIAAGAYAEDVTITTEHITLTGAGSGLVTITQLYFTKAYATCTGMDVDILSFDPFVTHIVVDDVIVRTETAFACADHAVVTNCDFTQLIFCWQSDSALFSNIIVRQGASFGLYFTPSVGVNTTFENLTIMDVPSPADGSIRVAAGTNTTFTNTIFEHPENAILVSAGTATFIQNDRKVFVGTAGINTVDADKSTLVVANGTYDYRDFVITPDASITVPETSLWETSGDRNKRWKVEATGVRTIAFQLGDMLTDTEYNLLVDGAKVSSAVSDEFGVITFPAYSGTFSEKVFETGVSSGSVPRVMIF